jgi:transposase
MRRHELSHEHVKLLEPFLPSAQGPGHPWNPHHPILNGIFYRLRTGCQWRDIPERYGPWQTIYDRSVRWRRDGTWDRILHALQLKLDQKGEVDWEQWSLDSTSIRAHRAAAGARKKGGATATNRTIMP